MAMPHQAVLYKQIIHALQPKSSGRYIDGTVGAGGHARGVLEACAPDGRLLAIDVDSQALVLARKNLAPYGERVTFVQASYLALLDLMRSLGWDAVDGVLLDLGVSSMQLDTPERGFSFQYEAPLDMRFNRDTGLSAAQLVNAWAEADTQLAEIVKRVHRGHSRIHPATRTFQALRIAVNDELSVLEKALPRAIQALRPGGRLAIDRKSTRHSSH